MYRRHRSKRTANAPWTIRPHRKQKRSRKSEGRQSESEKAGRDGPTWRRTQKRECERPALRPAASDDDRTALNARRSNGNIQIPIAAKTGSDRPVGTRFCRYRNLNIAVRAAGIQSGAVVVGCSRSKRGTFAFSLLCPPPCRAVPSRLFAFALPAFRLSAPLLFSVRSNRPRGVRRPFRPVATVQKRTSCDP